LLGLMNYLCLREWKTGWFL